MILTDYSFRLSYRDPEDTEKYFDDDEMWEKAQGMLKEAMDELGLDYYEAEGEAAFYGPKLDVQVKTALGKDETLSTVQLDFLFPERFDLNLCWGRWQTAPSSCHSPRGCFNNGAFCCLLN